MKSFDGVVRPLRVYAYLAVAQAVVATSVVAAVSPSLFSVGITAALCLVVLGIQWRLLKGSPTAHAILLVLTALGQMNGLRNLTSSSSSFESWFGVAMVVVNAASLGLLVQRSSLQFTFGRGVEASTSGERLEGATT